jgi:hypothetical protein
LNVRWYAGEGTEFTRTSAADIALLVTGGVLSAAGLVLGVVAVVLTDGAILPLAALAAPTFISLVTSGIGIGIGAISAIVSAISITAKDYEKTPSSLPGVELIYNPKYIIEGKVDLDYNDKKVNLTKWGKFTIRKLSDAEFEAGIKTKNWYQKQDTAAADARTDPAERQPVGDKLVELLPAVVAENPVRIYPSYNGVPSLDPARLSFTDSQNGVVELQQNANPATADQWKIIPGRKAQFFNPKSAGVMGNPEVQAYFIKHVATGRYLAVGSLANETDIIAKKTDDPGNSCLFFIIKSGNSYVFVPISRQQMEPFATPSMVHAGGTLHNGTRAVLGSRVDNNPGRSRWVVDPISCNKMRSVTPATLAASVPGLGWDTRRRRLTVRGLDWVAESLRDATSVRIFPALLRQHPLPEGHQPPPCLEAHPYATENAVLGGWDRSMPFDHANWKIIIQQDTRDDDPRDNYNNLPFRPKEYLYSFVSIDRNRYFSVRGEHCFGSPHIMTPGTGTSIFRILQDETGFFFLAPMFVKLDPSPADLASPGDDGPHADLIYCEATSPESRIKSGKPPGATLALARWMIAATHSEVARHEKWRSFTR